MPGWSTACFGTFKKAGDGFYTKDNFDSPQREDKRFSLIGDRKSTCFVELEKENGMTLGLIISGGIDKNLRPQILNLRPGSIAYRCDALAVGDYIVSVNGIRTSKLKHEEIVNLLKNADAKVTLEIEYEIPNSKVMDSVRVTPKVIQVKLEKENDSFGFTLRGGRSSERYKSRPLYLTHIRFGGPADRAGILKAGDRLLAVDGKNLSSVNLQEALQIIKQLNQFALFTIEYDVSCIDAVKNATGPLLVEVDRAPGCMLGINLLCLSVPEHAIVIDSIRQASIAERCGALHVGDRILAIDNVKIDLMTSAEAMQLLRSSTLDTVKLEILPVSQMSLCNSSEIYAKRGSLHSNSNIGSTIVAHADRTEVTLHADHKGFGFNIQGSAYTSDGMVTMPIISCIEQGSPADRSGVLQTGDRILSINGESTIGISLDKIASIIAASNPCINVLIEFDVAEAVVPSSGIFVMKLPKRDADLGISVTTTRNRQYGDPLIIADIKKGSVAHRTGSIQPGDKLLAINSLRTEHCTVEDATAILHTCTDIVKLRIRKDETFSDDPETTSSIVYTVKLVRHGGPLGITVSGTKDPFDPIYISGLTENGLAERTGALHIGDRILAINGTSLRAKSLNEAISILQTCGDSITLKISKGSCPERTKDKISNCKCMHCTTDNQMKMCTAALSSVDSAVDSWDSYNPGLHPDMLYTKTETYCNPSNLGNIATSYSNRLQPSQQEQVNQCNSDHQFVWNQSHLKSTSYSESGSLPSDDKEESWAKVLEDLQTCGQSRLLCELEDQILGFDENANEDNKSNSKENSENTKCSSGALSERNLRALNSQIEQLDASLKDKPCFPCAIEQFERPDHVTRHDEYNELANFCRPLSSFSAPLPIEIHKVTLFKDQVYEDFGFSLSDGKYENGVYINSIRPAGPADLSGLIKPLDRILQVNNVRTYNAGLIVPLIAASGDRIELVISRPAYDNESSSDGTYAGMSNYNPWIERGDRDDNSPYFRPISDVKTYTKTI